MSPTATGEIPSLERIAEAFPQLEVLELIGRGGMGFVFKARQPHLDRFVALKLLPDKLARDPQFAERFNREGRVLARLNHPNIVSVFDFGRTEHFYFLTMEYVDGVNLRQAMQTGRFSPSEALTIVPKICEALQYAHEQGVLHRDIKPENILLDAKGRVKIADFGIAKLVGEDGPSVTLTGTGAALGTPHYMAPEQLEKPSEVDHRADIYSLGVVFYEMLTGELPIGRFAPPSAKTPVNASVDDVVFRALEKDREKRYQSAGEVKTEVEHIASIPSPADTAPCAPAAAARPELQARVWVSTLKHSWSWLGQHYPRLRRGELSLWPDRLECVSRGDGRSVSLRNVTGTTLSPAPRFGWRRRANRLVVAFQEGQEEQPLEFDFQASLFTSRSKAEHCASAWLAAINQRITALTGVAPTTEAADRALGRVYPDAATRRLWNGLSLLFYGIVLLLLFVGWETLLCSFGLIVGAIVIGHFLLAWRRRALRLRPWTITPGHRVGPHGTVAVACAVPRWMKPVGILFLVLGALGVPPTLMALASSKFVLNLFVLLALTGVALLTRNRTCRRVALAANVLGLLLPWMSALNVAVALQDGTLALDWKPSAFGIPNSAGLAVLFALLETLAFAGGLAVLLRRDVKALFATPQPTPPRQRFPGSAKPQSLSHKAIWGAVLAGLALLLIGGPLALAILAGVGMGWGELLLLGLPGGLCGLAGTVLGWIALSEIRHAQGRLGGLPLAVFAALVCPLLTLVGTTLAVPMFLLVPAGASGWTQVVGRALMLLVPAGVITFALWAVYATVRWASGQPLAQRRGVLKWIFLGLLACGYGFVLVSWQGGSKSADERPAPIEESTPARTAGNAIRVKLRVPKGQVATLELLRRDTEPPTPVPFFSGYVVAPDDERGRVEFLLEPVTGFAHQTNLPVWSMKLVAEDGATVGGGFGEFGPLIPVVSQGSMNVLEIGPGTDTELLLTSPSAAAETNGVPPRAVLSLSVRAHERRAVGRRTVESTVVSIGSTNWMTYIATPPAAPKPGPEPEILASQWRQSPAGTNTTNWIRFTMTSVELRHLPDGRWLAMDYVTDVHGDCERTFRVDGNGFKAVTRSSEFVVESKDSPRVRHQRVEWRLPDAVKEADALAFRDTLAKEVVRQSVTVYAGEQRPLFRFPIGTVGDLSVGLGATLRPRPGSLSDPERTPSAAAGQTGAPNP